MLYSISVMASFKSTYRTVEAKDEDEASAIAAEMELEKMREISPTAANIRSTVTVSDENFLRKPDAIYLIKRYSSYLPARCIRSRRTYRRSKYEHVFQFLDSQRRITLLGDNPSRIGRKLCDGGVIGHPECDNCSQKFKCYTVKYR